MKGAIVNCLKEMVVSKFGHQEWEDIMAASGQIPNRVIMASIDIDDMLVMAMVENTCKILDLSIEEVADYFGDYWMTSYASSVYKPYYGVNSSAKDFLLKLNEIHTKVMHNIQNAVPPRFEYEWQGDNILILTYISSRGLIDFVVGLAKGVGNYFNQKLSVRKMSPTRVEIIFP